MGISPDRNEVQVWTGQQFKGLSSHDLLDVINRQMGNPSVIDH